MTDGVLIPLETMYGEMRDMHSEIKEMRGEIKAALASIADQQKDTVDHEARLRILEGFRWKLLGGSTVLGFFGGGGGALVVHLLTKGG